MKFQSPTCLSFTPFIHLPLRFLAILGLFLALMAAPQPESLYKLMAQARRMRAIPARNMERSAALPVSSRQPSGACNADYDHSHLPDVLMRICGSAGRVQDGCEHDDRAFTT